MMDTENRDVIIYHTDGRGTVVHRNVAPEKARKLEELFKTDAAVIRTESLPAGTADPTLG